MCWSGEASTVVAIIGLGSTVYSAMRGYPTVLWVVLGYFSLMEALQAYTYMVIDSCDDPGNQIATLLGYLHITFQPFFGNAMALYFIPDKVREKIQLPVYCLCFVSAIIMILQIYPFEWAGVCQLGNPLCGRTLCSISGNWHISWEVPTNGLGNNWPAVEFYGRGFPTYALSMFFLPIFYGSWRFTVYHMLMGPTLSRLLTDNMNEYPAIWCLLAIGMLLIVVKTPVHKLLFVKDWWLWPKKWHKVNLEDYIKASK